MNNIILVGFMGTGKSAVGRLLSQQLKLSFLDLDKVIEKEAKQTIAQIFASQGEEGFRTRESKALEQAVKLSNHVIATGGGVMLNPDHVTRLKNSGKLVCLTARPEVILERTTSTLRSRPLLSGSNPTTRIEELLKLRAPFYAQADWAVDTSDRTVAQVVEEIVEKWKTENR